MFRNTTLLLVFIFQFFILVFSQKAELIVEENDTIRIEIQRLSRNVNSSFNDYAPVITADGQTLFFTSRRPLTQRELKRNEESRENIYRSIFNEDSQDWNEATPLSENINDPDRFNSNIAISNDGQRLLIYRDDRYGNGDIYESFLKGELWSDPQPLPSIINSEAHESSASIAPDGRTIYYVSERKGGLGGRDIWKCTKAVDGSWGAPENLGSVINTKTDEESVFIHPDGKTLYFSSKGHNSRGGYDVYRSVRNGKNWSPPVNLGDPINTSGDDLFFVLTADGLNGYYASSRNGEEKDLYLIRFIPKKKDDKASEPDLTVLKGIVRDDKTKIPLEARISITDNELNTVVGEFNSNSASGKYLIPLPGGKNYGINVSAPGYLFHSENVGIASVKGYYEVVRDIDLKKLEAGTQIVLRNIFFDLDKYTLKPESKAELDRLYQLMTENPKLEIELSGHTDTQGSAEHNQQLSQNRAKAVVDYLVAMGIEAKRFQYKGYGESRPITSDAEIGKLATQVEKDAAHANNRRTEIKILKEK
jgi:outer membrane protein OmpA-like peptidoglycan-associated protein